MEDTLQRIERFHGHLGPYAVLGYKMGEIANHHLGTQPFSKQAIVWTGTTPPLSCIIDGIQLSSGCTLGTGTITVKSESIPRVVFKNKKGETIEIRLKPHIQEEIDTTVNEANIIEYATRLFQQQNDTLFDIQ